MRGLGVSQAAGGGSLLCTQFPRCCLHGSAQEGTGGHSFLNTLRLGSVVPEECHDRNFVGCWQKRDLHLIAHLAYLDSSEYAGGAFCYC